MAEQTLTSDQCVLRALNAAEIAESCFEPKLRAAFFELSESWLDLASANDTAGEAEAG